MIVGMLSHFIRTLYFVCELLEASLDLRLYAKIHLRAFETADSISTLNNR